MTYDAPSNSLHFQRDISSEFASTNTPPPLVRTCIPSIRERTEYLFQRRYIPLEGGKVFLKLFKEQTVAVDKRTMQCELVGWGISFDHKEVTKLPAMMARRFMSLFSKAESGTLTTQEEEDWLNVVDQVDYSAFSIDRSPPQYVEATILRKSPRVRIEWHDGEVENLESDAAKSLSVLEVGDRFGAYAKLDKNCKPLYFERLVLLP